MGNVACCKKPNEIIEDKDVFKKSTIKKTTNLQEDQTEPQNPFQKENISQNYNYITYESSNNNNNFIDLEETKKINNFKYTQKIDHQNTNGPSDNLRKKRNNKIINNKDIISNNNDYNNIKTRNAFEQVQTNSNSEFNKLIDNSNNNINTRITSSDDVIQEKAPQDKISMNNISNKIKLISNESNQLKAIPTDINSNMNSNINTNINSPSDRPPLNNLDKDKSEIEQTREKQFEQINTDIVNNNAQKEKEQEQNLNEESRNIDNNETENDVLNINKNVETQNININMNTAQKIPLNQFNQEELNVSDNIKINIDKVNNINNNNNINKVSEEPQNSLDNQNIKINQDNNLNNNPNYVPQNIIKNHIKIDSQLPDEEDPKDSNEVNRTITPSPTNTKEPQNPEEEENIETKEAFLQSADGQIIPTQQISDSEIAYLYQQCQAKGETEPDDDFNFESYKKFYQPDDPFFLFDKGEVSDGQIISSPDEVENLEIYEGEINEQNKKHGQGILTTPEFVRKGTWRNGEFTGWGRESRRNKEVLEGKFINGTLNGKGIFKNSKNNLYMGDFVNSKREGMGELYTNRIHYIGEFKQDKLDGKGIIEFLKEGHKYEGDFKNNEINGRGIFQWKNGDIYEGDMTDGKMNGHGIYRYANGQIYDGEYINGIREGKGRIIINNTVVYDGEFRGGHRMEKGRSTGSMRFTNNGNADNNDAHEIENN